MRAVAEVRQPQRDARQGRRAHALAQDGCGIDVRALTPDELSRVDGLLPLARLDVAQTYLVAWDDDDPIGHAHVAWQSTHVGMPEVQDVFVREDRRGEGIATSLMAAVEEAARARGLTEIAIGYGIANDAARRLYEHLGYRDTGIAPERVNGTIMIRGEPVHVDDTIVYLVKSL